VALSLLILLLADGAAQAQPRFLTLPFLDPAILVQQGWVFNGAPDACHPPSRQGCHHAVDYIKGVLDQPPWAPFDVLAAADGWAVASSTDRLGTFVSVAHDLPDGAGLLFVTRYAHLDQVAAGIPFKPRWQVQRDLLRRDFSTWTPVTRGEVLGIAGETGAPGRLHLHFSVEVAFHPVDPYDIYDTRDFYPGGISFTECGPNYLWIQCPP
jgi:hypothetical protein